MGLHLQVLPVHSLPKNNGTQAAAIGGMTHVGLTGGIGQHIWTPTQEDTNTDHLGIIVSGAGAVSVGANFYLEGGTQNSLPGVQADAVGGVRDVARWTGNAGAVKVSVASGVPSVDAIAISDDQMAADNLELDYDGTGLTRANSVLGRVTLVDTVTSSDAAAALVAIHLDHLLAADYDPATPPGVATALLNELVQDDGQGVAQFTAKALENVSSGGGGFINVTYRWSNDVTATDPTTGRVKANNAILASITAVYIHSITNTGGNASAIIEALDTGDTLLVAVEGSGGNFFTLDIDAIPTDNGAWYTITGTVSDSGGSISNNNTMTVTFAFAADDAVTIASAVWNALRAAHTNVGTFGEPSAQSCPCDRKSSTLWYTMPHCL